MAIYRVAATRGGRRVEEIEAGLRFIVGGGACVSRVPGCYYYYDYYSGAALLERGLAVGQTKNAGLSMRHDCSDGQGLRADSQPRPVATPQA